MRLGRTSLGVLFWGALGFGGVLSAADSETKNLEAEIPAALKDAIITEKLGAQLPLDTPFVDESGNEVALSQYFNQGKPVILSVVYFDCPGLCNFILNGLVGGMRLLKYNLSEHYDVITLSMDHRENSQLAAKKKASYLKEYGRLGSEAGWHFLTGTEENIRKVTETIGFGFRWDAESNQYAHSSGIFILSPTGKLTRLFYGVEFPSAQLRLALLEASEGRVGTLADRVMMFCFKYDPNKRGYALAAVRLVQAGAGLTLMMMGLWLWVFWRRQRSPLRLKDKRT